MAEEPPPVQQRVRLRHHQRNHGNRAPAHSTPDRRLQPLLESSRRLSPVEPIEIEREHQVRDHERRDYRKLARLSGQPKPHQRARNQRVPQPPLARHPHHEVQRGDREHRLKRVHREEVAELYMYDRKRSQRRRKQPRPAVEHQRSDAVHRQYRNEVRQPGHRPPKHPYVIRVIEERPAQYLHELQNIQGKAAIVEPARIPRALLRIQQQPKLTNPRRRYAKHPVQYRALIRVRRVRKPRIPRQPVEAQRKRNRKYGDQQCAGSE